MDGDKMKKENGFTLIEVMVAMVVLLIGILGVMVMQYNSIIGNSTSMGLRVATSLTTGMMEQLQGTPYNNLANGSDIPYNYADPASNIASRAGVVYTRSWWVLPGCSELGATVNLCTPALVPACAAVPDAAVATSVAAIRVRTCWTDKNGINRSVEIDSLVI